MKKMIGIFVLSFIALNSFAQESIGQYYVNKCVSLLGKTVPSEFKRFHRTAYKNDEDIMVGIENGIIIVSAFGSTFDRTNEAADFNSLFYNYFENNNWQYYRTTSNGSDIYFKNSVYACIFKPTKRDDGQIVTMIGFSNDINKF